MSTYKFILKVMCGVLKTIRMVVSACETLAKRGGEGVETIEWALDNKAVVFLHMLLLLKPSAGWHLFYNYAVACEWQPKICTSSELYPCQWVWHGDIKAWFWLSGEHMLIEGRSVVFVQCFHDLIYNIVMGSYFWWDFLCLIMLPGLLFAWWSKAEYWLVPSDLLLGTLTI